MRAALGIAPEAPVTDLMHKLERSGVLVLAIPQELDALDGFAVWVNSPSSRPVIALLGGKAGYRMNFTLGEELGHLVLHSPLIVSVAEADLQARQFAREFLLPKEALLAELETAVTLSSLAALKPRWHTSIQLLLRRAFDLERVTPNQYRYLNQQVRTLGWTKCEPGDESIVQPRPRLLRKMAELRYGTPVDLERLAAETGIPSGTVAELIGVSVPARTARVIPFKRRG